MIKVPYRGQQRGMPELPLDHRDVDPFGPQLGRVRVPPQ